MFLGSLVEATWGRKTTLIRKWRSFANGKLEVRLVPIIGTESWVPHSWMDFIPVGFFGQCPGTPSERKIITKKCLRGPRSTGSLPDGDNHGSSNKPTPDSSTACLLASTGYVHAHTSPNRSAPKLEDFPLWPSFSEDPLVGLCMYISSSSTAVSPPRAFQDLPSAL